MNRLKKLILTMPLAFAMSTASASVSYSLVVELTDGMTHEYSTQEKPKVTFTDNLVKVSSFEVTAEYPKEDFSRFYFIKKDNDVSGTDVPQDELASDRLQIRYLGNDAIAISCAAPQSVANIYTVNGLLVASYPISNEETVISIKDLASGIYILNVNTQSIKILKK